MTIVQLVIAAIALTGVTGEQLKARAFFDANNVKVGDPLILTIDFLGTADFKALHPPALSRVVDRKDWKLDDSSAKTQTETHQVGNWFSSREIDVARRLTYRVRPMRAGVLYFPMLAFEYETPTGEKRIVRTNEIPVHARPGADVVVAEMGADEIAYPAPPALVTDAGVALSEDESFAWRKACAKPSAEAFAAFEFPAAKLNEAHCAIVGGDWVRALRVCQKLEWRTGQTPELEQMMVAALALRYQNPTVELPVWRQVGRPILRYDWRGRIGGLVGGLLIVVLVFGALSKIIRALACVAIVFAALSVCAPAAWADDPFAMFDKMMQRHRSLFNFGGAAQEPVEVKATLTLSQATPRVGEIFRFIISLEVPKGCTVSPKTFKASRPYGLTFVTGQAERMSDGECANTNNVLQRIAIPARYDVPFQGRVGFSISGTLSGSSQGGSHGNISFSFTNSFDIQTNERSITVRPLEHAPAGYAGLVATGMRFEETADALTVGTNDVIVIHYRMSMNGWLPEAWSPEGVAFECGRTQDRNNAVVAEWRRYFVADGAATTPVTKAVYYDPEAKAYKTVTAGGSKINYNGK